MLHYHNGNHEYGCHSLVHNVNKVNKYFRLAKKIASRGSARRQFRLGAVGVRTDGAIVTASNLSSRIPEKRAHAEARVVRKLDYGSEVYVVRILRDGTLANARPCSDCQAAMRRVKRIYYSISEDEYGVIQ
jgi:cytidine deaminase